MKHFHKIGKQRGTLILLHGNSSSIDVFSEIFNSSEIENSIITIPLPGHAYSDNQDHYQFSTANITKSLISFVNDLDEEIFLIGNSFGGHLAIEIASQIKNLKGLMIFGTAPLAKPLNFEEAFLPVEALQTFLTPNPNDDAIAEAVKVAIVNDKLHSKAISDFKATNPDVRVATANDIMNSNWQDQKEIFINLPITKFIVKGIQDPSVNPNYLEKIQQSCLGNCEMITLNNCGHYPTMEQPNKMIRIINKASKKVFS